MVTKANALFDYIRDLEASGIAGATYQVVRLVDDHVIAAGTTATDPVPNSPLPGMLAVDEVTLGFPGPVKYRATDPQTGITREHTSKSIGIVGPIRLLDLPFAFAMMLDGVIEGLQDELAVTGTGSQPPQVSVAAGACFGHGLIYRWPEAQLLPLNPGGAALRHDLIVLRYYLPGHEEEGRIDLAVKAGTEGGAVPALTQDDVTTMVWEVALAEVQVDPGVNFIAGNKVTDQRIFTCGPRLDTRYIRKDAADTKTGALTIIGPTGSGGIFNVREDTVIRLYVETGTPAVQLRNGTDFLMYSGNKTGLLCRIDGFNGQMDFGGIGKPTISKHGALGGSGAVATVQWGNDNVCALRLTAGNTPAAGNLLAVIFNKNRQTSTYQVTFSPENGSACDIDLYATGKTQDHFDVTSRQSLDAGKDYWWSLQITGAF